MCSSDLLFGREILLSFFQKENYEINKGTEEKIKKEYNFNSLNDLYELLGSGTITAASVLKKIYPEYKGHRNRKKPCGYRRVISELQKTYEVVRMPELEADDAMGIYATANPGNIIVSPDKDMRQIPGKLFNLDEVIEVTAEEGMKWHLVQTLAGDQTDGYSGVPGIGVKRAVALFEEDGYSWDTVVKAFASKDLDEDAALMNARLARILTCDDYDPINQSVIPWTATSGYRIDTGAAVQTTED